MPSITFDLETITPLFLSGADQTTAELRPPAFRGALRYWFRAIAGAYYWDNPNQLRELESSIFGDAGKVGGSNIIIRLSKVPSNVEPQTLRLDKEGLKYLWFSTKAQSREGKPARKAIEDLVRFSLTISTRPNPKKSIQQQKNLLIASYCFWLAINLGGFGSRERRGAGSLEILRAIPSGFDDAYIKCLPKFDARAKELSLTNYYSTEINRIQKLMNQLVKLEPSLVPENSLPNFDLCRTDLLNKPFNLYLIDKPNSDWVKILDHVGCEYSAYRREKEVKERYVFGLPLKSVSTRRPSPLRIKIIRNINNYYCLFSWNYGAFPSELNISRKSQFAPIDQFINRFSNINKII